MMRRFSTKVFHSCEEALSDIKDKARISLSGFGIVGNPENSLRHIHKRGLKDLVIYTNSVGLNEIGQGPLLLAGQVSRIYVTFIGFYHCLEQLYLKGKVELVPMSQGSMAEQLKHAQGGLGGFYTRTTAGTWIAEGKFPIKYSENGKVEKLCEKKEVKSFDGVDCVYEQPLVADFGLIKAYVGDRYGNLRFRKTSRNFNPDVAGSAKVTIAEVEYLVDRIEPEKVHLPGAFVDRIYQGEWFGRKAERLQIAGTGNSATPNLEAELLTIAKRLAKEFQSGMYINLGLGIPVETPKFIKDDLDINFQIGSGIVGGGKTPTVNEIDTDLVDAARYPILGEKGHSFMPSSETFGIMRGHHLHMTVLGGIEASEEGDLANYFVPGKFYRGVGGAMDLVTGCDYVLVGMRHFLNGKPRILKKCKLPLTGSKCIDKLVTEYAVFEFPKKGQRVMTLVELIEGMSLDELKKITPADYVVSKSLKKYQT